jgi:hypothetical protein
MYAGERLKMALGHAFAGRIVQGVAAWLKQVTDLAGPGRARWADRSVEVWYSWREIAGRYWWTDADGQ